MGFWSSVGSFVSSAIDAVSSVTSSVVSTVKDVVSTVRDTATKVIDKVIEYGGKIVGAVKNVYETIKPYIAPARKIIQTIGNTIGLKFPWVKAAAEVLDKGLAFLEQLDKNPLVQKISKAIEWGLKVLEEIKQKILKKNELEEAYQRQHDLQEAYDLMKTDEQKQSVRFAMLINDFIIVKTRITDALENFEHSQSTDFEYYLRLRATQKLLDIAERKLNTAQDLKAINDNDLFLIKVGTDLLAEDPTLSEADAQRLDKLIQRHHNKKLLPFVFEELIIAWQARLDGIKNNVERLKKELAMMKVDIQQLKSKQKVEPLSNDELVSLSNLEGNFMNISDEYRQADNDRRSMENYIYASEGFLQMLEKTEEEFKDVVGGDDWIIDSTTEIGTLLIRCVEQGVQWEELTDEEQDLIRDFALIFKKQSEARFKNFKNELESRMAEIEVAA